MFYFRYLFVFFFNNATSYLVYTKKSIQSQKMKWKNWQSKITIVQYIVELQKYLSQLNSEFWKT